MAKRIIGALLLFAAACAFAEDAVSFDASALDPSKLDFGEARIAFAGPCTFLVTGVVYDGVRYTALLEYDGVRSLKVREPAAGSMEAAFSLDLSHAFLAAGDRGSVTLRNVVIDGYAYTLDVVQTAKGPVVLGLEEHGITDMPVSAVQMVAASDPSVASAAVATANAAAEAAASAAAAANAEVASLKAALAEKDKEIAAAKAAVAAAVAAAALPATGTSAASTGTSAASTGTSAASTGTSAASTGTSAASTGTSAASTGTSAASTEAASTKGQPVPAPAAKETVLLSGFPVAASPYGAWSADDAGLFQKDGALLWAKYPAAVDQSANEIVYRVSVKSLAADGWVGSGIHVLASGDPNAYGWGFGRSLLVWLTRDPKAYGDARTRLQLYYSTGPTEMAIIADTQVSDSINDGIALEIAVRRDAGTIAVSLGGERKLLYTAPWPLPTGERIAFRALGGPIVFTGLRVGTR